MVNGKIKMYGFIKYIFIFKIVLYILIINLFIYLTAFSQTNIGNFFVYNEPGEDSFSKERQLISVNLLPSHLIIFPSLIYNTVNNIENFAGLAKIDISDYQKYIKYADIIGNFWYIPDISYTFLLTRRIGIEAGISAHSISHSIIIPKNNTGDLMKEFDSEMYSGIVGSDTSFKVSFVYIPIHIGLKLLAGMNYNIVNTFRFGVESIVYNVETVNGVTGIKTKRTTTDATLYISYELGWNIDLFPNKNWRVKPYLDISLFEIGYYIRTANKGIYNDIKEGISYFGSGLIDINTYLPVWDTFPRYIDFITSLRIAIFPRVGITIRF